MLIAFSLALLVPARIADVTVSDSLVSLASSVNGTKNHTFTDAGSGQSRTVVVTLSPVMPLGATYTLTGGVTIQ